MHPRRRVVDRRQGAAALLDHLPQPHRRLPLGVQRRDGLRFVPTRTTAVRSVANSTCASASASTLGSAPRDGTVSFAGAAAATSAAWAQNPVGVSPTRRAAAASAAYSASVNAAVMFRQRRGD
jgi:hypothetical protein